MQIPSFPFLFTEEVLERCAAEGVQVSVDQLKRWGEAGLLSRPVRRSLGRGAGTRTEWVADTPDRAVIIARSLGQGDPSLRQAARALAGLGAPLRRELLGSLLVEEREAVERMLTLYGSYRQGLLEPRRAHVDRSRKKPAFAGNRRSISAGELFLGSALDAPPLAVDDPGSVWHVPARMLRGEALLLALASCDVQSLLYVVIASEETAGRDHTSLADALVGASVVGAQQHGESIQALLLCDAEAEKENVEALLGKLRLQTVVLGLAAVQTNGRSPEDAVAQEDLASIRRRLRLLRGEDLGGELSELAEEDKRLAAWLGESSGSVSG